MKPCDLDLLHSVSAPTTAPDGSRCVIAVTRPDFRSDAYVGQLWSVPLDGQPPRRLTRGFRDTDPRFSPDGATLVFLRTAPGERPQLAAMDAAGGEPVRLTDQPLGVSWFRFSPDSRQLVFSARVPDAGRYGSLDGVGPAAEDPRLVETLRYRMNGVGYTADKPLQVFLLDLPDLQDEPWIPALGRAAGSTTAKDAERSAEPGEIAGDEDAGHRENGLPEARRLTHDATDHTSPVFSADGSRILYAAARPGNDTDLVTDIHSVRGDGTDLRTLSNLGGGAPIGADAPVESPDGSTLYYLGSELGPDGTDFVARNTSLYAAPSADPGNVRRLTDPERIDLAEGPVIARADGVLVFNRTRGRVELLHVTDEGGTRTVAAGRVITGADEAAGNLVVSFTDARTAGDIALISQNGETALTDFSAGLRSRTQIRTPEEVEYQSPDGYPVHGWLVRPDGEGPHPVLLNIHGGPFAQYTGALFDEAQVYAEAGYAVLMCNPRGSAGYGQEHGRIIKGAMGTVDLADVLAFLDGALDQYPDALDAARVGILGGSYGGYLTAWTIAHEHRFAAAVVERGFLDPVSFTGSADIGWFFGGQYTGTDPRRVEAQSPMAKVGQVRTPVMVIHSEEDLRCPVEQAQRYFAALKMQGTPASLLLFPGENHELSRNGTPWHRRQRFEHILRWWQQHLPSDVRPAGPEAAARMRTSTGAAAGAGQ